jgi:mono/diheme cytochrome c family protein
MNMFRILFFFGIAVLFLSSCYYDKEDQLYGTTICDTTAAVSYSKQILPIFQRECYSCHSGGSPSGGIAMGTYAADKALASSGRLYGSISYASGYSPMPKDRKLSSCNITMIKKWIAAGSLNN